MGGLKLETIIGIDFSANNVSETNSRFLHNVDPSTDALNEYELAMSSFVSIMEHYAVEKCFLVYGFPGFSPTSNLLKTHDVIFNMNLNSNDPICSGIKGILEAYRNCLRTITECSHPLNLIPIIETVTNLAKEDPKKYYVLLILTTGKIHYPEFLLDKTLEAINDASSHPISIIMIGIGDRDFKHLEMFANDQPSTRRILKFLQFNKFKSQVSNIDSFHLAQEALSEVPEQLISFMVPNNILPNRPTVDPINLPQNRQNELYSTI